MSFYLLEDSFENGTIDTTIWNGTNVDVDAKFNILHYTTLTHRDLEIPYRGAYAADINLSLGANPAYLESTVIAQNPGSPLWIRFYLYTSGLVMANNDTFALVDVQSAGPASEAVIGLRQVAGRLQVFAGETVGAGVTRGSDLLPGWHCIELGQVIDTGVSDGTIALYVDGYPVGAVIGPLTQTAITQVRLGVSGLDPGTTAGHILLDDFIMHPTRIYGRPDRYQEDMLMTKSGCVIPGPGWVKGWTLMGGSAGGDRMRFYDRDTVTPAPWMSNSLLGPEMVTGAPYQTMQYTEELLQFRHGLWCDLAGSEPRAYIKLGFARLSAGSIRNFVRARGHEEPF